MYPKCFLLDRLVISCLGSLLLYDLCCNGNTHETICILLQLCILWYSMHGKYHYGAISHFSACLSSDCRSLLTRFAHSILLLTIKFCGEDHSKVHLDGWLSIFKTAHHINATQKCCENDNKGHRFSRCNRKVEDLLADILTSR